MENRFLAKGMANIFVANIINLIFSLLTNFLLPKYLPVELYAGIKTFQLYCVYIGIMHLGFVDGMFLKYGGKRFSEINYNELSVNLSTMRIFQLLITAPVLLIGILFKDVVIIFFACSIAPLNMVQYFKFFFQSVGEFKRYGKVMNIVTGATFIANVVLMFGFRTESLVCFLILYLLVNIIIWFLLEVQIQNMTMVKQSILGFSLSEFISSIKNGFFLMIGNFISTLLSSMDRWFVKALLQVIDFAQYSFAVSVESVINVAITPITVTLYNFFCKNENNIRIVKECKSYVTLFATLVVAVTFPAKFIIEVFLTDYYDSVAVIFYLFAAQIIYIIIKAVYVNLYKAKKLQNIYFVKVCVVIILGFFLNIVCFCILGTKEAFAIGTLLSAIIWLLLSEHDFRALKYNIDEYIYLTIEVVLFLICGIYCSSIVGMMIYISATIVMDLLVYRKSILNIFSLIRRISKF